MNTNLSLPDPTGIIDRISSAVDGIYGYPAWLIVALACLIVGFCLKRWSRFPNEAIPLAVILFGGLFMAMMAPDHPAKVSSLRWKATNFLVGVLIGFFVWLFHNKIWKAALARYPILGSVVPSFDTEAIKRSDVTAALQPEKSPVNSVPSSEPNINKPT